jgi:hypothetical protein
MLDACKFHSDPILRNEQERWLASKHIVVFGYGDHSQVVANAFSHAKAYPTGRSYDVYARTI